MRIDRIEFDGSLHFDLEEEFFTELRYPAKFRRTILTNFWLKVEILSKNLTLITLGKYNIAISESQNSAPFPNF